MRTFSDVLNRVRYRGEAFIVERGGEAVCRIEPVAPRGATIGDLVALLSGAPAIDPGYAAELDEVTKKQQKLTRSPWAR